MPESIGSNFPPMEELRKEAPHFCRAGSWPPSWSQLPMPVRFEVCWLLLLALSLIFSSPDCICAVQLAHFIFRLQKSGGPYILLRRPTFFTVVTGRSV